MSDVPRRTWWPSDGPVLPPVPDSAYPLDAKPLTEPPEHRACRQPDDERLIQERWRRLRSALIAVSDRLQTPYTDASDQTPWSRFILPSVAALDEAIKAEAAVEARVRAEVADLLWNMSTNKEVWDWLLEHHTCTSECEHGSRPPAKISDEEK